MPVEITLDSGCCDHVLHAGEVPGYTILQSAGSRRRQHFVVGNGHKVPNQGEVHLNLDTVVGGKTSNLRSVFQVAEITRPLMSVSRITDQGLIATFDNEKALIKNKSGDIVCEFQRKGGLYVTDMMLRRPTPEGGMGNSMVPAMPFGRPGR